MQVSATKIFRGPPLELVPQVLFSDNHLLVISKPAGMPSQPDHSGATSVYDWATAHIREEKGKVDGNVFCGIVHRLDRNVSGVMVLARTSKGASRLGAAWTSGKVKKGYLALVSPPPQWTEEQLLVHHLERVDKTRRTTVHQHPGKHTKVARTRVTVVASQEDVALVNLVPETGRPHQLRAQMSVVGSPILGDRKYGSSRLEVGLCLHAFTLSIPHPTKGEVLTISVPPPRSWRAMMEVPQPFEHPQQLVVTGGAEP